MGAGNIIPVSAPAAQLGQEAQARLERLMRRRGD
jgi:hypothetical protein